MRFVSRDPDVVTVYWTRVDRLFAIQAEWTNPLHDYLTRVAHLRGAPGGLNGDTLVNTWRAA